MLSRRWPNGIIPFRFDPNFTDPAHKAEVRAAIYGSDSIPGCTAESCVGWDTAQVIRFIDCEQTGDFDDQNRYVYLIASPDYNGTRRKRGYKDLRTEHLKPHCTLGSNSDCRLADCDLESNETCVFDVWLENKNDSFLWSGAHELGHMLGFNHEQSRHDREAHIDTSACGPDEAPELYPPDEAIGPYDVQSVMHYPAEHAGQCFEAMPGAPLVTFSDKDLPSSLDMEKLELLYGVRGDWIENSDWCIRGGRQPHLGDFDSDGQADLLCLNAKTGHKAALYARGSGPVYAIPEGSGRDNYGWLQSP